MGDVTHEGRTVLFVSHNMPAMEHLCSTGILLASGSIAAQGSAREVSQRYLTSVVDSGAADVASRKDRHGSGQLRFLGVDASLRTGGASEIRLAYAGDNNLRNVEVSVAMFSSRGEGVANLSRTASTGDTFQLLPSRGTIVCSLPRTPLRAGRMHRQHPLHSQWRSGRLGA